MIEGDLVEEKVSICICTRNRTKELKNALNSISMSIYKNYEIIVSDDSTNDETRNMIIGEFSEVKYLKGPQKGLCFNRNNALQKVTGSRVLFIDDDVVMSKHFLEKVMTRLQEFEQKEREKMIVTGIEKNRGLLVFPNKTNFLGHQTIPYKQDETLKTIVINSTIFPVALFKDLVFDEQLIYGYDEVDIASRAISLGYEIILMKEAINNHFPSAINRDYYSSFKEASRIYVTFKRYRIFEKKKAKSILFIVVSIIHLLFHELKKHQIKGILTMATITKQALVYIKTDRNLYKNFN